jgi:hypothetical protein
MVTGHTEDIKRFDLWVTENYTELLKYCKNYRIEEDLLNDTYLNVRERIMRSGFTETYFKTYIVRSLRNLQINEAKKLKNKFYINVDNKDYETNIENTLIENDEIEKDTMQYREDVMSLSKMLFKYIETKAYDNEMQFVFRCYYLMRGRMTYAKLTKMTGINKNKCTKIIQTMKQDIRENFLQWLNGNTGSN